MQTPATSNSGYDTLLLRFIRRQLPVLIFLGVAFTGMFAVYWYFNPFDSSGRTQAVAAAGDDVLLTAPINKPIASREVQQRYEQSAPPQIIAIIVGHRGSDSGAVCEDGLMELAVNTTIAEKAAVKLQSFGYNVILFDEFDVRLSGFEGTALVSIHADSCTFINDEATGYKTAVSSYTDSSRLSSCINQEYGRVTQLPFHENTITEHMTDYHAFRKIAVGTPAIILETGFMNIDRELLTTNSDAPSEGVVAGIICFVEGS